MCLVDWVQLTGGSPRYYVSGNWDDWQMNEMNWDAERSCFQWTVCVPTPSAFQIVVERFWERCIYPDVDGGGPSVPHRLCGPGENDGNSWFIDKAARYELRMHIDPETFVPQSVDWIRLNPATQTVRRNDGRPSKAAVGGALKAFIHAACPSLPKHDVFALYDALVKVGIRNTAELITGLKILGKFNVNARLTQAKQQPLEEGVLRSLRAHAQAMERLPVQSKAREPPPRQVQAQPEPDPHEVALEPDRYEPGWNLEFPSEDAAGRAYSQPQAAPSTTVTEPEPTRAPETAPRAEEGGDPEHGRRYRDRYTAAAVDARFDGRWKSVESGEHVATIFDGRIAWADGPAKEYEHLGKGTLQTELCDGLYTAQLTEEGDLKWSDGDVWRR